MTEVAMKSMLFNLENELNNYNSQMTQLDIQILQLKDSLSQVNGGIFALKEITKKIKQMQVPPPFQTIVPQMASQSIPQMASQSIPQMASQSIPPSIPVPENVQVPSTIVEEH
jgi:hypothetical protein